MYGDTLHQILCMSHSTLLYMGIFQNVGIRVPMKELTEWEEMSPWTCTQTAWSDLTVPFAQLHVLYIIGWPEFEKGLNPRA